MKSWHLCGKDANFSRLRYCRFTSTQTIPALATTSDVPDTGESPSGVAGRFAEYFECCCWSPIFAQRDKYAGAACVGLAVNAALWLRADYAVHEVQFNPAAHVPLWNK